MKTKLLYLIITLICFNAASFSQRNNCDNNAGGQLTVGAACVPVTWNSTNNTDYWNNASGCGATDRDDVWGWFTATSTNTTITYQPAAGRDAILSIFTGACNGTTMTSAACANAGGNGVAETISGPTVIGNNYRVRVQRNGSDANMNGTICVYNTGGGGGGGCEDQTIAALPFNQTGMNTSNGSGDNYDNTDACSSSYMGGDEYIFDYTPLVNETINITLTNTDTWVGIFVTDDCPDVGNCVASNTNSGGNPSVGCVNLIAGTTYYFTVSTFPAPQTTAFDIDIQTVSLTPPANDECGGAIPLTVNSDLACGSVTSSSVADATNSGIAGCSGTADDDVWFSFVATSTDHNFEIQNIAGSTTDLVHEVFSGTCPGSLTSIHCSDPNTSSFTGFTIGNVYYVRVYSFTGTSCQTTTFDVCVGTPPPAPSCGLLYTHSTTPYNPQNYNTGTLLNFGDDRFAAAYTSIGFDFCYDGVIYQDVLVSSNGYITFPSTHSAHPFGSAVAPGGTSDWSISAAAPNTNDAPVNAIMGPWQDIYPSASAVDGEIRTQTSGTTPNRTFTTKFKDVRMFSCTSDDFNGQITLLETTDNVEVHMGEKTMCPGFNGGAAILGLTDYSGTLANVPAGYNYPTQWTVTTGSPEGHRWTSNCGVCVLPVELVNFKGKAINNYNLLSWQTETEINNDYFILEKSDGGAVFYEVAKVEGAGNSNTLLSYTYKHTNPRELEYYRLKQVDFNGKYAYSKIIAVRNNGEQKINIYPNPTKENFSFEVSQSNDETYTITYTNMLGSISSENINISEGTNQYQVSKFIDLPSGIYFIQILNETGEIIKTEKVIKK